MTPNRAGSRLGRLARVSEVEAGDEVAARVEALRAEIAEHNRRYHGEDAPTISDAEFDELVRELRRSRRSSRSWSPRLAHPAGRVGAVDPVRRRSQHRLPMMSLDNAFSAEELLAWGERLERAPRRRTGRRSGRLRVRAEDRRRRHLAPLRGRPLRAGRHPGRRAGGRGRHRQHRAPSTAIPERLPKGAPDVLEVRGEVYMPHRRLRGAQRRARPRPASGSSSTPATPRPARCARRTRRSPPAASSRSGATSSARSSGGPALHQPPRDARVPRGRPACR